MIPLEHEVLVCQCENTEHQLIFSHFPDELEDREVYMSVHLIPEENIFKRIWKAVKYIFGHRSIYGHFDDFIFKQCDSHKLVKILKYLDPDVLKNISQESKNDSNS